MKLRFFGAVERQVEHIDDCIRTAAIRAGDVEAARVLADYYTASALEIDPHTDWWTYAKVRQQQADYQNEHTIATRRAADAAARVRAEQAKLKEMQ